VNAGLHDRKQRCCWRVLEDFHRSCLTSAIGNPCSGNVYRVPNIIWRCSSSLGSTQEDERKRSCHCAGRRLILLVAKLTSGGRAVLRPKRNVDNVLYLHAYCRISRGRENWSLISVTLSVGAANLLQRSRPHSTATWLMQSGKDPFKISDFLATSVPTLLKHYGHHNPDHQFEIAEAISARPNHVRKLG
jgi:hypothetical protein